MYFYERENGQTSTTKTQSNIISLSQSSGERASLLPLYLALRQFSLGPLVFLPPQKHTLQIPIQPRNSGQEESPPGMSTALLSWLVSSQFSDLWTLQLIWAHIFSSDLGEFEYVVWWLRFVSAFLGSLVVPVVYEVGLNFWLCFFLYLSTQQKFIKPQPPRRKHYF